MAHPVRATQKLVDQMGWVFRHPDLTALEIAWRWLFGLPLLWVCWRQGARILAALPPESTGLNSIDAQNPWVAAVQLADVWARYEPTVGHALGWLVPLAALSWLVVCHPALSSSRTACAPLATLCEISSRWSCIMSVSA